MKKIVLFVVLMLAMSLSVLAQRIISETADVSVALLNQEPDPVEPGEYVDVRFQLNNNGSQTAQNLVLEILPEYPFSLDPGKSAVENVGSLYYSQGGEAKVVRYRLRVDQNALPGDHDLKIRYRFNNEGWIEPKPFSIDVRADEAIVTIDSASIGKDSIEPGTSGNLKIKVTNTADILLKNLKATLDLGNNFVAVSGTNEKVIGNLGAKETSEFNFNILVSPETSSGVYRVPLRLTYSDTLGRAYSRNGSIGIVVNAKPDLSVTIDETTIYEAENKGEIVIKVVNKGVTDVKFMTVSISPGEGFRVLSNKEMYLGNIDSDDFETAEFNIFVDDTKEKKISIPVVLQYKDANNNNYKDNIALGLELFSSSEAKKLGLKESGSPLMWIFLIAVLVVGFFLFRRYRRKKSK